MNLRLIGAAFCVASVFACPLSAEAQTGIASFYGKKFHGRLTANGERFDMNAATCAHKKLRFGTQVRVVNLRNGKSAVCRINDRGPFVGGRVIDVSRGMAKRLGMVRSGTARVSIQILR